MAQSQTANAMEALAAKPTGEKQIPKALKPLVALGVTEGKAFFTARVESDLTMRETVLKHCAEKRFATQEAQDAWLAGVETGAKEAGLQDVTARRVKYEIKPIFRTYAIGKPVKMPVRDEKTKEIKEIPLDPKEVLESATSWAQLVKTARDIKMAALEQKIIEPTKDDTRGNRNKAGAVGKAIKQDALDRTLTTLEARMSVQQCMVAFDVILTALQARFGKDSKAQAAIDKAREAEGELLHLVNAGVRTSTEASKADLAADAAKLSANLQPANDEQAPKPAKRGRRTKEKQEVQQNAA
jgi:hypothetical protein